MEYEVTGRKVDLSDKNAKLRCFYCEMFSLMFVYRCFCQQIASLSWKLWLWIFLRLGDDKLTSNFGGNLLILNSQKGLRMCEISSFIY